MRPSTIPQVADFSYTPTILELACNDGASEVKIGDWTAADKTSWYNVTFDMYGGKTYKLTVTGPATITKTGTVNGSEFSKFSLQEWRTLIDWDGYRLDDLKIEYNPTT
ncbi:MAG TPA: hypothetical protein VGM23_01890 [Armatimonadota bacterium]|jgi:hypothetical protein